MNADKLKNFFENYRTYESACKEFIPLVGFENEKPNEDLYILKTPEMAEKKYKDFKLAMTKLGELTGVDFGGESGLVSETLIRTTLFNTKRFYGDRHIDHALEGGNTGEHPIFAAIKFLYTANLAGVLDGENKEVLEKIKITKDIFEAIIYHDNGEIIEFGSLATEIKGGLKDIFSIEKEAAFNMKKLGLQIYQTTSSEQEAVKEFFNIITPIQIELMNAQEEFRISDKGDKEIILLEKFNDVIFKLENTNFADIKLNEQNTKILDGYLDKYREIEGDKGNTAKGLIGKIAERLEGNGHYITFSKKFNDDKSDFLVPSHKAENSKVLGNYGYIEDKLGILYQSVRDGSGSFSEAENNFYSRVVKIQSNQVYNDAKLLALHGPATITRGKEAIGDSDDRFEHLKDSVSDLRKFMKENGNSFSERFKNDSLGQSSLLYAYMKLEKLSRITGFDPGTYEDAKGNVKGVVIAKSRDLPNNLDVSKDEIREFEAELKQTHPDLYHSGLRKNLWNTENWKFCR